MSKNLVSRIAHPETSLPSDVVLRVDNVSKKFCKNLKRSMKYGIKDLALSLVGVSEKSNDLRDDEFWAVKDVSFDLKRGECLGLIGRNGCGKTTLLRLLAGIFPPDRGSISVRGRVGALISLGAGFHPHMTGRENIYLNGAILGLSKKQIDAQFDEIVDFAEIGDFIEAPVSTYSSGMRVRLGFAVATAIKPDLLLIDEILAVGDLNFQAKCFKRIGNVLSDCAVIFVSHNKFHVKKVCDRAILLERGVIAGDGNVPDLLARYIEKNAAEELEKLTIFGEGVSDARIEKVTENLCWGRSLEFDLSLNIKKVFKCDLAVLNIADHNETVHAQVYFPELETSFKIGNLLAHISIGPLHVSKGLYVLNFFMNSEGGKATELHLRRAISFEFDGPTNYGCSYYPPAQVSFCTGMSSKQ